MCSAATNVSLIGNRLDDLEVYPCTRLDTGHFARDLSRMPVFSGMTLRPATCSSSLRLVVSIDRIRDGKPQRSRVDDVPRDDVIGDTGEAGDIDRDRDCRLLKVPVISPSSPSSLNVKAIAPISIISSVR